MPVYSLIPAPSYYLDPGSGSIVFQMIVAAILGTGVVVRSQWARIKKWFGSKSNIKDKVKGGESDSEY